MFLVTDVQAPGPVGYKVIIVYYIPCVLTFALFRLFSVTCFSNKNN